MATTTIPRMNPVVYESGTTGALSVNGNSYTGYSVTFTKKFTTAPYVVLTLKSSISNVGNAFATVAYVYGNPTTTGFTLRLYNNTANARSPEVYWLAVGE